MEPAMFHELLQWLTPRLMKADTNCRKALEPELKLAVTFQDLATGKSYHRLAYSLRIAINTISLFIREVCETIIAEYGEEEVSPPAMN